MTDEGKQYETICKGEFAELNTKLDDIHRKLYIDNGAESIQSRLNRYERWIRGMAWLCGIAASASVVTLVTIAIKAIWTAAGGH